MKPTADTDLENRMLGVLSSFIRLKRFHIVIPTDYNILRVNFAEYMYIGGDHSTEARFFNLTEDLRLSENVKLATHWRNNQTLSRPYCILTNKEFVIGNLPILDLLGKSNHPVIAFSSINKAELKHPTNDGRWNFKRLNVPALQNNLQQVEWEAHAQLDLDAHWDFSPHTIPCETKQCVFYTAHKLQATYS